jgi:polyphosphate kinase
VQRQAEEFLETPLPLDDPSLYANRELSWLDFNDRVFEEALDSRNPLLERVRFLAITSANLDEFFSTRVGWLTRVVERDPLTRTVDDLTVADQLALVLERCRDMRLRIERCWSKILAPALASHGIRVVSFDQLDTETRTQLSDYFMRAVYMVLTPLVVDPMHPFPFISGGSLSLVLNVRDPRSGQERFARVKVPANRPRLVDAGDRRFVLLEDLIAAHAHLLFPGADVTDVQTIRVLRSAELDTPGEEAEDLVEVIESELRRRRFAAAVSLEVAGGISPPRLRLLLERLELEDEAVVALQGPLGLADLMPLANLPLAELAYPAFTPAIRESLRDTESGDLFDAIHDKDILVHHPFESFDASVARFVHEAAHDPAVLAIKHTMYRTSPDSPILQSLIEAAARGKQVVVLVELSARYDEANNIEWARRLEEAGVHVAYGNPRLKIHGKLCLVVREESTGVKMYGHIGTGNYNSRTAKVYTDLGLFTSDPEICADLLKVFNHLTGVSDGLGTKNLLVAPTTLRSGLVDRVQREIDAASAGQPARIIFKMNALEDYRFTRLLYEASQAGVQVDLIVRGICRLRPGLPGISENVRVVSIIGRFLEHSRVYYFENGGQPECFIGSADLMKRNLDERIEVLTPVRDPALMAQLRQVLDLLLEDRRQGWELRDRTWTRDPSLQGHGTHQKLLEQTLV